MRTLLWRVQVTNLNPPMGFLCVLRALCGELFRYFFSYPANLIPDGMTGPEIHWFGIVLFVKLGDIQFDSAFSGENAGHYSQKVG